MATNDSRLVQGRKYSQCGDYGKAINEFTLLLASNPNEVDALYYRGCVQLRLERYKPAIDDFNSAISSFELSRDHELQAFYKRGYAYYKSSQFNLALDDYRRFINKCEEYSRTNIKHKGFFGIGCIHATLHQYEQAIDRFKDAIHSSKGSKEDEQKLYYLHRGRAFGCCAKYAEAKDDLNRVIQQSKNHFVKGCAYNELGQHQLAIDQFNNCHSDDAPDDHVRFRRGLSHASLDSHSQALEEYQLIPRSSSIIDRVFFRKGMSNMALNDAHNALIEFNQSTEINDQQSDVFYARGMLYFTLGRHNAAVNDHRRAMQLDGTPSTPLSAYQTFHHTHHHHHRGNDTVWRNFYQNQLNSAKNALKNCKDDSQKIEYHQHIAEYYQQLAPYTHDTLATHQKARPHIDEALNLSSKSTTQNTVINAIYQLREADILCEKYPGGIASKRIVEQFIDSTVNGIAKMNEAFERCSTEQDWKDLSDTLTDFLSKSHSDPYNRFNSFRHETIEIQLEKVKLLKQTMNKFADSPQQLEFYKLVVIRLCNIFDATRAATTGIFQHALTGTLNKVSWGFMILGKVAQLVPAVGNSASTVLGGVEKGLKELDHMRIQNALSHIGCLETAQKLNETAHNISEKLTMMYEKQIRLFPTTTTDKHLEINKNHHESKKTSACRECCNKCIDCLKRTKNKIANEREDTVMQTIAKYAISLILDRLTEIDTDKINGIVDLRDSFINAVCNVSFQRKLFRTILATKITKLGDETEIENNDWDTRMFFCGPVVQVKDGVQLTSKHMNSEKYGYRGPSWNEEDWCDKNDLKKLEQLGLNLKKEEN